MMKLREEWEKLLAASSNVLIFGTGSVGLRLYELMRETGQQEKVSGFLVTSFHVDGAAAKREIDGKQVVDCWGDCDHTAKVLVSVSRVYHPEVYKQLEAEGFLDIIEAHKFYNLELKSTDIFNENIDIKKYADTEIELDKSQQDICRKIILNFCECKQAFGGDIFYQSYPPLGIKGERLTDVRLESYGVKPYLTLKSDVLDIGCNCGFLDMVIADEVRSVTGIEYNEKLVEIARKSSDMLGKSNIAFFNVDYKEWQSVNTKKFDIIFSCAVHIWLNISPKEYALQLYGLLKSGGHLVFESQTLQSDKLYEAFCKELDEIGLKRVKEGYIKDDGKTDRRYAIFEKE